MKESILGFVNDAVLDIFYYNRKDDELGFPVGVIEKALEDGIITREEMVEKFKETLDEYLS